MNNQENKWPLIGNSHITDFLDTILLRDSISHFYIFQGSRDLGKFTTANFFAKSLLCQNPEKGLACGSCQSCRIFYSNITKDSDKSVAHADFHVVKRGEDKKNISIEQIRDFIKSLNMSSFVGKYKIGIIKEADKMSKEAFNALLKTLEEPKKDVIIILLADDIDSFPATIVSRSQVLYFRSVKFDCVYDYLVRDYQVSREKAKEYARLSLGRPALAKKFLEDHDFREKHQKRVEVFFDFFEQNIAERFQGLEDLVGQKLSGQIAVREIDNILQTWLGCLRDWLMSSYGHFDLLQNCNFRNKIEGRNISQKNLLQIYDILNKAHKYLQANVNPKLVLESVAVNFPV